MKHGYVVRGVDAGHSSRKDEEGVRLGAQPLDFADHATRLGGRGSLVELVGFEQFCRGRLARGCGMVPHRQRTLDVTWEGNTE